MSWIRWDGPEAPHEEAYSRVTNPDRFAPLHTAAESLLDELCSTYLVKRHDGYGLDPELESAALRRPSVSVVPTLPEAAPLVLVFTAFPGLRVRAGHWLIETLPSCGCDACSETADDCIRQLRSLVSSVVQGRLIESIELPRLPLPVVGDAWLEVRHGDSVQEVSHRTRLTRGAAERMLARGKGSRHEWEAWPRR